MKFPKYIILSLFVTMLFGCAGREKSLPHIENEAATEFERLYPGTKVKQWAETEGYMVADFKKDGFKGESWFDNGNWIMTITCITLDQLPEKTLTTFRSSGYSDWELTGCRKIDREGRETIYVIDVERNKVRFDLYYNQSGILVRSVNATETKRKTVDFIPREIPPAISDGIKKIHPNAIIFEVASNSTSFAIDIIDNNTGKKAFFDNNGDWLYTTHELTAADSLPTAVRKALACKYGTWQLENAIQTDTPDKSTYTCNLIDDTGSLTLVFNEKGRLIK